MVQIQNIDIKDFKKIVYPEYLKLFPDDERKPLELIESLFNKGIMNLLKITYNNCLIGFMITNIIDTSKYIQLDYFAILPQSQNKGYGTVAIDLLKKLYNQYNGIFVEVEKIDSKINIEANKIRQRRINFYKRIGFEQLNYEFKWFDSLVLIPYVLPISNLKESNDIILNNILNLYLETHGNKKLKQSLQVIKN